MQWGWVRISRNKKGVALFVSGCSKSRSCRGWAVIDLRLCTKHEGSRGGGGGGVGAAHSP
jgi:hypothetical protein